MNNSNLVYINDNGQLVYEDKEIKYTDKETLMAGCSFTIHDPNNKGILYKSTVEYKVKDDSMMDKIEEILKSYREKLVSDMIKVKDNIYSNNPADYEQFYSQFQSKNNKTPWSKDIGKL